jgi:hypothetical protein
MINVRPWLKKDELQSDNIVHINSTQKKRWKTITKEQVKTGG